MEKEYVDMGLPSGTLWASENEKGYFTFDEALEKFGNNLPARWQFCELVENSDCYFDTDENAFVFESNFNGNMVIPVILNIFSTGYFNQFFHCNC